MKILVVTKMEYKLHLQVAAHAPLLFHLPGRTDAGIQVDQLVSTVCKHPHQHHHQHHSGHHHHYCKHNHHHHHHHHAKVEFVDIFPTIVDAAELEPLQLCPEISNTTLLCTEVVFNTTTNLQGEIPMKKNNKSAIT